MADFWFETWPALRARAEANQTTVREMFEEPIFMLSLFSMDAKILPGDAAKLKVIQNTFLNDITGLENLKLGGKFKANHRERIKRVMGGLLTLSALAFEMEEYRSTVPSFDPTAKFTVEILGRVVESLDDSALDSLAKLVARGNHQPELKTKAPEPTVELAPIAEPALTWTPPPIQTPAPTIPPQALDQLADILKDELPLSDTPVYKAKSALGHDFTVQLSSAIVREDQRGQSEVVRRLLKTIFHGTGSKSGIKNLFDIGPGIIELKAHFRGHKRIIGCMEGRHLRLIAFLELGESKAAYARKIPSDLCR